MTALDYAAGGRLMAETVKRHGCDLEYKVWGHYGPAVHYCGEEKYGAFPVNFCPQCGAKAPTPAVEAKR